MAVAGKTSTRDALLDAVEKLLGALGYRKLTVDDVAQAAGLSRRTFYLHFAGKEEATLAALDRDIDRLVEGLRRLARDPATARERLEAMLRFRVRFLHEKVRHRTETNDEIFGQLRPLYMPRREGYLAKESVVFAEVLEEGRRGGELRFDDAGETAILLLLATNAFLPFGLSPRQLRRKAEIDRRVARMAGLLLRGLDASETSSRKGRRGS
ncbi:MAG TPA: TetR/AcrR family transcriptional regulator [Planctomycetia bacterium]|nr:TetR/AcrR family transcriptional regulator [Planctomycetia bacterium]